MAADSMDLVMARNVLKQSYVESPTLKYGDQARIAHYLMTQFSGTAIPATGMTLDRAMELADAMIMLLVNASA